MKNSLLGLGAASLILSLGACGASRQPEHETVSQDANATVNAEEGLPANAAAEETAIETTRPERAAPKPAPAKPASAKPAPAPEPEPEPAPNPHVGHDMSNMSH